MNCHKQQLPVIQSLWVGNELSKMEQLCIKSFLDNGHPFHLYAYNEITGLPDGVVVKDANEILPEMSVFKYKDRDTYSGFANMFRYKLLLEKGSFWVDMDIVCIEAFEFDTEYVFASVRNHASLPEITNFIIKAPANSPIMESCYQSALCLAPENTYWGMTGPKLIAKKVIEFGLESFITEPDVFAPVIWQNFRFLISSDWPGLEKEQIRKVKAVHLWNEMWRLNGVGKNTTFNPDCVYEQLKNVYDVV